MRRLSRELVSAALLLLLLGAPIAQTRVPSTASGSVDSSYGRGFWNDPCTWDGFIIGFGAATQNWGMVAAGAIHAWKVDSCSLSW